MKIEGYQQPKSSFLSVEKDLEIIVDKISKNKRIQRLLYYTTPDALDRRANDFFVWQKYKNCS